MKVVRKRLAVAVAAGLVGSVALMAAPAPLGAEGVVPTGDYVVTFDPGVDAAAKARKERALGNEVSDVFSEAVDGLVATLDAADVRRLRRDSDVLAVEPNSTVRIAASPGRYIVQLRDGASSFAIASSVGATNVLSYSRAITGFAADLTAEAYDALAADRNVVAIEPDAMVATSDTQLSPLSWGLDRIDQRSLPLDRSYTYPTRGTGVRAYVIDTGIRSTHVQFAGRVGNGYDGVRDGNGTADCHGHGTHVAGTIAGVTAGVAKSATLVPVRVLGCAGSGWLSDVIGGIDWVIADHANGQPAVANLSLGGAKSSVFNSAVARGISDGIVFVVAAGNLNADACNMSPASAPNAITVGAVDSADVRASFSNWGTCLDIFAPGVGITSSTWSSDTALRTLSGTSMAAPHVAGAAALILESDPALTPAQVTSRISDAATSNAVTLPGVGSPNKLLFVGGAGTPTPTTTTTTVAPTTTVPASTTTVPAPTTTVPRPTTTTAAPTTTTAAPTTTTAAPTTTTAAPTTTTIVPRPANDDFGAAAAISGNWGLVQGSNLYATRQPNEPTHGGSGGAASLWYRWTAPADGDLVVATGVTGDSSSTSSFDTLLGVYTGADLAGLAVRAVNDDVALSSGQLWSRVAIEVTAGTVYNIAVDGWGGARGQVRLSWAFTAIDNTILPSEPRSVTVSALDGSGYVNWSAPVTTGRGTITYTATASPGGASCSTVGLRCLIGGLANGTQYSVRVTARNTAGVGPASDPPVAFTPNTAANRPIETRAWGLDRIDQRALPLNGVISRSSSGRAVTAYVIDTGVLASHVEFGTRVGQGRNTIEGATNPTDSTDCNGHGTHVAGTIAGASFGVAPDAAIIPVKVLDCYGSGSLAGVIAGIDWMITHHQAGVPAVANMSLGGSFSVGLNAAVARAIGDGITVVVAAGNSNADACGASPASEPLAITVGATERSDARAPYSNYGSCVDIFAPGSGVLSAGISRNDAEATLSGTSMASPHVAGAAALLLETTPSLTPNEVVRAMTASATRGVVTDAGVGSPDGLLFIGPFTPPSPTTTTTIAPPPTTAVPANEAPMTTVAPSPAPTSPPAPQSPDTTAAVTTTVPPVTSTPPTASASQSAIAADATPAAPSMNATDVVVPRGDASTVGVRSVTRDVDTTAQPTASIVQSTSDRVLVKISNATGSVDILVNGKAVLRTMKRVVVLRSKGIASKRVTVRASRAK